MKIRIDKIQEKLIVEDISIKIREIQFIFRYIKYSDNIRHYNFELSTIDNFNPICTISLSMMDVNRIIDGSALHINLFRDFMVKYPLYDILDIEILVIV
jgi:hypothetical protein